jgi:hypothetical protein
MIAAMIPGGGLHGFHRIGNNVDIENRWQRK